MSVHQVNEKRRALIKSGLAAGAAMSIGIPVTSVQAASARKSEEGISWHKGVCRFCGTGCGLQVGVRDGRIIATKGDPDAPVNRGLNCVKGYFNAKIMYGRDRLTQPLMRRTNGKFDKNGKFEPVSWDEAFDEMARQFKRVYAEKGPSGVALVRNSLPDIRISFRLNPETQRPVTLLNGEEVEERIRTMEVSSHVSPVAALGFVREALVKQQQEMGRQKGIVMDGRDIGTVVFPDAELKIFVTASADIRARRRYDELKAKGRPASYDEILKNVEERDYIDQNREVGPLRKAEDAILLDNSHMTIAEQKQWLAEQFQKATNG